MNLYEDLVWRGLIKDVSSTELKEKLNNEKLTFYIGTDPTADSLHIGHFSSFLICKRLKDAGHNPIILVGGATALIGDPRGTNERELADPKIISENFIKLKKQIQNIFPYEVINNYDWVKDLKVIDFLRDYGKYININYMINKDLVKRQMDSGISYAEFSYMLIQGLDFKYLYENKNVTLQVAGSDQWGNITTGIELIRKTLGKEVYAFTMPLVTKSDGTKFGKSEGEAIWLDKDKTTPYEMYQFFLNSEDDKVIEYLKRFTFLSKKEIELLEESNKKEPHLRLAHKTLAENVVEYIHGKEELENATRITNILFNGNVSELASKEIVNVMKNMPKHNINDSLNIVDLLVQANIATSKREAREFISSGSITINGKKELDCEKIINSSNAIDNKYIIIRKGKKKYFLIEYK